MKWSDVAEVKERSESDTPTLEEGWGGLSNIYIWSAKQIGLDRLISLHP